MKLIKIFTVQIDMIFNCILNFFLSSLLGFFILILYKMDEYTDLTTIVNETSSGKLESDPSAFYIGIAACTLMSSLIVLVSCKISLK